MSDPHPVYFDSALIAKFYLNEPGRDAVRALAVAASRVVSSSVAVAEVSSAFHRKLRESAIDNPTFKSLTGQFAHDLEAGLWTFITVSDAILDDVRAMFAQLKPGVYLRSLDALHIITAKSERFETIHTNDRRLLDACPSVGIKGVNPLV